MGDLFDKKLEKKDPFLDKCLDSYREISDMLKKICVSEDEFSFSTDLDKFDKECSVFLNYIHQVVAEGEFAALYLSRNANIIQYGKFSNGIRSNSHTIEMVSANDLKRIYDLLHASFLDSFDEGFKHTFGEGWSLLPVICEKVVIDISSSNSNDRNWFYTESHKMDDNIPKKKNIHK